MRLYQAVTSPFAVRVRIAIYAKNLDVEFAPAPGGMGSDEYRQISPLGKVPCLVCDDGTVIVESGVINEYLEDIFPAPALLAAAPIERARARMVVQITDTYVFANYLPLFALAKAQGKESLAVAEGIRTVRTGLAALERVIGEADYAVGDALSLADCALAPALFYITAYAQDYLGATGLFDACPKIKSYWERVEFDPHVARALADK